MTATVKKKIAEYYSRNWKYWDVIYTSDIPDSNNLLHQLTDRKNLILRLMDQWGENGDSLSVLDAGCGPGILLRGLEQKGHRVLGVDISTEMVARAQKYCRKAGSSALGVLQGDLEHLPLSHSSFDVIICVGVLSHLENVREALREMSRVLKQDGVVFLTVPNTVKLSTVLDPFSYVKLCIEFVRNRFSFRNLAGKKLKGFLRDDAFIVRKYFFHELNPVFYSLGFHVEKWIGRGYGPVTFWRREILPYRWSLELSRVLGKLVALPPFAFFNFFPNYWLIRLKKRKGCK